MVLGNGGVAHTVVKALQDQGTEVTVVGRNWDKVSDFAKRYSCRYTLFSDLPMAADLCVNATPVGQFPNIQESPLTSDQLDFELIYDLVYRPRANSIAGVGVPPRIENHFGYGNVRRTGSSSIYCLDWPFSRAANAEGDYSQGYRGTTDNRQETTDN